MDVNDSKLSFKRANYNSTQQVRIPTKPRMKKLKTEQDTALVNSKARA